MIGLFIWAIFTRVWAKSTKMSQKAEKSAYHRDATCGIWILMKPGSFAVHDDAVTYAKFYRNRNWLLEGQS